MVGDVVDGPMPYSDPYMIWYWRITVMYVGDPTRPPPEYGYRAVRSMSEMLVYYLFLLYV